MSKTLASEYSEELVNMTLENIQIQDYSITFNFINDAKIRRVFNNDRKRNQSS